MDRYIGVVCIKIPAAGCSETESSDRGVSRQKLVLPLFRCEVTNQNDQGSFRHRTLIIFACVFRHRIVAGIAGAVKGG